ncbi:NHL repeat-containing protein [bacterium]|nr:NHL repeat-containing protein [bacterium]
MKQTFAQVAILLALGVSLGTPTTAAADDFVYPLSAVATDDGTIYVADLKLPGILKIKDGKVSTYYQGSKKFREPLNAIRCLAIDHEGKLLAGDSATREVYRFGDDGKPTPLTKGFIGIPMSIAVAKDGTIYVADVEVSRIWKMPAAGGQPEDFASINARGVAVAEDGNVWVVSPSSKQGQVLKVDAKGKITPLVTGRPFKLPHNIAFGPDGSAYVSDNYSKTIWKVSKDGKTEKWIEGDPLVSPVGLSNSKDGVLVVDPRAKKVFLADDAGKLKVIAGP